MKPTILKENEDIYIEGFTSTKKTYNLLEDDFRFMIMINDFISIAGTVIK